MTEDFSLSVLSFKSFRITKVQLIKKQVQQARDMLLNTQLGILINGILRIKQLQLIEWSLLHVNHPLYQHILP